MFPPFFFALEDPPVAEPWLGEELDVFVVFGACFNPDGLLPLGDPPVEEPWLGEELGCLAPRLVPLLGPFAVVCTL